MKKAEKGLVFQIWRDEIDKRTERFFTDHQIEIGSGKAHPWVRHQDTFDTR